MKVKNPNMLLRKLKTFANKNIRDILKNQSNTIIYPVPKSKFEVLVFYKMSVAIRQEQSVRAVFRSKPKALIESTLKAF